jgi:hypothetical protein
MPGPNIWRSLLTPRKAASRRGSRSHDFAVAQSDEVRSPGGINVTVVGDVVYGCKSPTSREEDDDTVVSAAATAPLSRPISLRSSVDSDDGQRLAEGFRLLLEGGDKNLDRACSWFGEAAAACPADASSLHAHAILLVRQQRCHEAEEIFKRILALEGECPTGRTLFRYASLKQLYLAEMVDIRKERAAILEVCAPSRASGGFFPPPVADVPPCPRAGCRQYVHEGGDNERRFHCGCSLQFGGSAVRISFRGPAGACREDESAAGSRSSPRTRGFLGGFLILRESGCRFAQGSLDLCEKIYCQILKISEDVDTLSGERAPARLVAMPGSAMQDRGRCTCASLACKVLVQFAAKMLLGA